MKTWRQRFPTGVVVECHGETADEAHLDAVHRTFLGLPIRLLDGTTKGTVREGPAEPWSMRLQRMIRPAQAAETAAVSAGPAL